jgi:Flp pilus assembly protein TadD
LKQAPNDAESHLALGTLLMNQKRFAESQAELISAVKLDPKMADAWGNLAVVAAENNQYSLAIQAIDQRSKLVPEDSGTYYLRATVYDHMRDYKQAAENYHQFLSASNGKFPDLEWKARHRLVAIEPKKK